MQERDSEQEISNIAFFQHVMNSILTNEERDHLRSINNVFFLFLIHKWKGVNTSTYSSVTQSDVRSFFDKYQFPYFEISQGQASNLVLIIPFKTNSDRGEIIYTNLVEKTKPYGWGCENNNPNRRGCLRKDCVFYDQSYNSCDRKKPNIWLKEGEEFKFTPSFKETLVEYILDDQKIAVDSILKLFYKNTRDSSFNRFLRDFNFTKKKRGVTILFFRKFH
jgi:hypothetical protein